MEEKLDAPTNKFRKWGGLLEVLNSMDEKHENETVLKVEKHIEFLEQATNLKEIIERLQPLREYANYICSPLLDNFLLQEVCLASAIRFKDLYMCKFLADRCKGDLLRILQPQSFTWHLAPYDILFYIANHGSLKILRYFIEKKGLKPESYSRLLSVAIQNGKFGMVKYLEKFVTEKERAAFPVFLFRPFPKILKYLCDKHEEAVEHIQAAVEAFIKTRKYTCAKILCEKYKAKLDFENILKIFMYYSDSVGMLKFLQQMKPINFDNILLPIYKFRNCCRYLVESKNIRVMRGVNISLRSADCELFEFCIDFLSNEEIEKLFYRLVEDRASIFSIMKITEKCEKNKIEVRTERLAKILQRQETHITDYFEEKGMWITKRDFDLEIEEAMNMDTYTL